MATALVTQIAYAVQTLFDPAGTAGRLVDLGKLANYGLLGGSAPTVWLPSELFTTGVNGAWYDPSDFSTMFQNAAGTTPVTAVEQPVGLMLDKSKGLVLGPELVTNGDFSNGTTGWTAGQNNTVSVVSGQLKCVSSQADGAYFGKSFSVESGKTYKFVYQSVSDGTSQTPGAALGTSLGTENRSGVAADGGYAFGSRTFIYRATANETIWLWFYGGIGKPVGNYILIDNISVRELPGNHAYNLSGNSANFPVLSARYNLLTKSEDATDSVWSKQNITLSGNTLTASSGGFRFFQTVASVGAGVGLKCVYTVTPGTASVFAVRAVGFGAASNPAAWIRCSDGAVLTRQAGITAQSVVNPDGSITVTVTTTTVTAVSGDFSLYITNADQSFVSVTGQSITFVNCDVRVTNDALNQPAYQRVNTATDYDTVGFKPYLAFNGVNQWLQTNSIDFTYGDKMFVSAGVRKLSDASAAMLLEMGTGSPYISVPESAGVYGVRIGSNVGYNHSTFSAPSTSVISSNMDRAASTNAAAAYDRFNGVVNTTTPTGTPPASGNFGNYPLYIGARAGTSLWFDGRLYGLVVAGKAASDSEIASTEAWLNQKTGAY